MKIMKMTPMMIIMSVLSQPPSRRRVALLALVVLKLDDLHTLMHISIIMLSVLLSIQERNYGVLGLFCAHCLG